MVSLVGSKYLVLCIVEDGVANPCIGKVLHMLDTNKMGLLQAC